MSQLNEKLSTAAKVAIGALIYQQVKRMKMDIKSAQTSATLAQSDGAKKDKEIKDLQKRLNQVASAGADLGKSISTSSGGGGLQKNQLDQIRKMIRKEVGRILFDIYKLRNAWTGS